MKKYWLPRIIGVSWIKSNVATNNSPS